MFLITFGINHYVSENAFKKAMFKGSITPKKEEGTTKQMKFKLMLLVSTVFTATYR